MKVSFNLIAVFVMLTSGSNARDHFWPKIVENPPKLTCSTDGVCQVGIILFKTIKKRSEEKQNKILHPVCFIRNVVKFCTVTSFEFCTVVP